TYPSDDAVSIISRAVLLVDQILSNSLIGPIDSTNNHRDLEHMLKRLRQILCIVNRAIELYDNRQSLTYAITQEVGKCRVLLSELRDRVHGTWVGLMCTRISDVWRQVFRERWDGDELGSL